MGGEGEGEDEIIIGSSVGFGRRRLLVGRVGNANRGGSPSRVVSSSWSEPVSSMSSLCLTETGLGNCRRRDRGDEY